MIHAAAQITAADWRRICAHHPTRYIGQVPSAAFLARHWREELYEHEREAIGDVEEFRVQVIQALRRKA